MKIFQRSSLILFTCLAFLGGCGGGSDDGGSDDGGSGGAQNAAVDANGLWEGTVLGYDVIVATHDGRLVAYYDGGVIFDGTYTLNGSSISGAMTSYEIVSSSSVAVSQATFSGTVTEQRSFAGQATAADGTVRPFSYTFMEEYNQPGSLSRVAGTWSDEDTWTGDLTGYPVTATIDSNGALTGQNTRGCMLNGQVSVLDANINLYGVRMDVGNCPGLNGRYDGFATLLESQLGVLAFQGEDAVAIGAFDRQ